MDKIKPNSMYCRKGLASLNFEDSEEDKLAKEFISDTLTHQALVSDIIKQFVVLYEDVLTRRQNIELMIRMEIHDYSKLHDEEEFRSYVYLNRDLKDKKYGTPEYFEVIKNNNAVQLHYKNNKHHPEHYTNGIIDMCDISILEMLADWMGAHRRRNDSDDSFQAFQEGLIKNYERFKIPEDLQVRITNSCKSIVFNENFYPNIIKY